MSQSSQSITLTRLRNGVSYSAMLAISKGDLWQQYDANKVAPDFTVSANQPQVTLRCLTGEGDYPDAIEVYWDGAKVPFSAMTAGSVNAAATGLDAGTIKIVQQGSSASAKEWVLAFVKNVAVKGTGAQASHTLKVVGIFGSGAKVSAQKSFDITMLTESGESVHIEPGLSDTNPFVVDQIKANSKCTLVAQIYSAGDPLATPGPAYTYQWYRMDATAASGWTAISGATSQTLTVSANDVDAYAVYRVTVTHGTDTFSDSQSVMDIGDPFYVAISVKDGSNASATPNMDGDVPASEKRVFTASLASRSGATAPAIISCYWLLTGVDGVALNTWSGTNSYGIVSKNTSSTTLSVPASWMDSINAQSINIDVTINY